MFLVQEWLFFQFFFQTLLGRKMSFTICKNEKTPFQAVKKRSSKGRKIDIFQKGLTHGFDPKMTIFPTFFFRQYRPGKCLLRYSRTRKASFQAIKKRISKSRKIHIFSKGVNPCLWSKNGHFSNFFFQALLGRKMSFTIFQNNKKAFRGYKNKKLKKSKMENFSKGVNAWFWSKNGHFSNFFFQAIQARKMSFTIFQNEKTPFQAIKRRSSKSRKIDIFSKGLTHGFGPKMAIFPTFFFRQYRAGKCLLRYFRTKKCLSRL